MNQMASGPIKSWTALVISVHVICRTQKLLMSQKLIGKILHCKLHRYTAPEVLDLYYNRMKKEDRISYTEKIDIWSIGVILYLMFSSDYPFHTDDDIRGKKLEFRGIEWLYVTDESKKFIGRMLQRNVSIRSTVQELLLDDWFDASTIDKAQKIMGETLP